MSRLTHVPFRYSFTVCLANGKRRYVIQGSWSVGWEAVGAKRHHHAPGTHEPGTLDIMKCRFISMVWEEATSEVKTEI